VLSSCLLAPLEKSLDFVWHNAGSINCLLLGLIQEKPKRS
jgi:hypothetical protein